jgi:transcriptional regulator with XRE-family HTH domain
MQELPFLEFAIKLRAVRIATKLTQKKMALLLEISQHRYSIIERGDKLPDVSILNKIATILNVEVSYLVRIEKVVKILPDRG